MPAAVQARRAQNIRFWHTYLTCDTFGGLEGGRLADLLVLVADRPDLRTNRGCKVARCRMSGR